LGRQQQSLVQLMGTDLIAQRLGCRYE
jgi:hypothetical protein